MGAAIRLIIAITVGVVVPSNARAFSGAEYLSASEAFADGYSWGLVEGRVGILWSDEPGYAEEIRAVWQCLSNAGVTSATFGNAVRGTINSDPAMLTAPATSAIVQTLNAMCPPS